MPFAEHRAPRREGEDIFKPPPADDPRVKPWMDELVKLGVINSEGKFLKPKGKLMRGIGGGNYLWRVEWEDK